MKFSYNWLNDYLNLNDIAPEEAAEILTLHSFETELVKKTKEDAVLDVDILPNRFADSASHLGLARELGAILSYAKKKNFTVNYPKTKNLKKAVPGAIKLEIEDRKLCPRYAVFLIEGAKVGPSPSWLKQRLSACGVGSINNIVDLTNFIMLELGQPVHAFDYDKISGGLSVRRANRGEKITLLDNRKIKLCSENLVIADQEEPLAIAGIKGGKKAMLDKNTKNILLEVAHFEKTNIYLSSKKLQLATDAAKRFSSGIDPKLVGVAGVRAATLVEELTGGILRSFLDLDDSSCENRQIILDLNKLSSLLGFDMDVKEVCRILRILNITKKKVEKNIVSFIIPSYRNDLILQEDLVEEIARFYGYNRISPLPPYFPLVAARPQPEETFQLAIRESLKGAGFIELYNYSFTSANLAEDFSPKASQLKLKNPISERFAILRPSLFAGLTLSAKENLKHENQIRFFEIGKVFVKSQKGFREKSELGLVISLGKGEENLFEAKGVIELLLNALGLEDFYFSSIDKVLGCKQNSAIAIWLNDKIVGKAGLVCPKLAIKYDLKQDLVLVSLDLEKIFENYRQDIAYREISKYPAVRRDLAILVDKKIKFSQILNTIDEAKTEYLQDIDLFDIYQGEGIPSGKKSLAFHLTYQSQNQTLTDEQVNHEHGKIEDILRQKLGAQIR